MKLAEPETQTVCPAEVTTGARKILSLPKSYNLLQDILGGKKSRQRLVNEYIQPKSGERLLDIGCGTAEILENLPADILYEGFDLNASYIAHAQARYGSRGQFRSQRVSQETLEDTGQYDVILAIGLLHHLEDDEARHLFKIGAQALKPQGRMITLDPCFTRKQNPVARFLISQDRGQRVREELEYKALARSVFPGVTSKIRHDLLNIPYTHCVMICTP